MVYVALLRGINVGGNSKVEMSRLKETFQRLSFMDVRTYINSGNVIFSDQTHSQPEIVNILEEAIESDFGFRVKVLIRDQKQIDSLVAELPASWVNDQTMKCDVMFLGEDIYSKDIMKEIKTKPEIEDVKYLPGAVIWRIDRKDAARGSMIKLIDTKLYKSMTVRNCNTVRKLAGLMSQ